MSGALPNGSFSELYPEWKEASVSDHELRRRDFDPILHGISREKYESLDSYVERFDETYRCGTPVKEVFYNCFEIYHRLGGSGAGRWFPVYEDNLRKWGEMKPDSSAPYLALVGLVESRGWFSRGEDVSSTVSEEGWKEFEKELNRAWMLLDEAPDFVKEDVHYWYQRLSLGLGRGIPYDEMLTYFREGQKRDPHYLPLYQQMAWYLQPRWYGETPFDWHDFLVEAIDFDGLSEEDKTMVYGIIVRFGVKCMDEYQYDPQKVFKDTGIDVPRFLDGLAIYVKRYPESSQWPIHYLYHAQKAEDPERMKDAIQLSERTYDPYNYDPESMLSLFEKAVEQFPELAGPLGRSSKIPAQ